MEIQDNEAIYFRTLAQCKKKIRNIKDEKKELEAKIHDLEMIKGNNEELIQELKKEIEDIEAQLKQTVKDHENRIVKLKREHEMEVDQFELKIEACKEEIKKLSRE